MRTEKTGPDDDVCSASEDAIMRMSVIIEGITARMGDACARPADRDAAELVRDALAMRSCVDDMLGCAVQYARGAGLKWREIGEVLGVTRQAAQAHFGNRPAELGTTGLPRFS